MTNKVTLEHINHLLDTAEIQEHLFHYGKSLIISYKLLNGFTIDGRAAVVDLANFDIEIGRKVARENAINQLWALEGYLLQNVLAKPKSIVKPLDGYSFEDLLTAITNKLCSYFVKGI